MNPNDIPDIEGLDQVAQDMMQQGGQDDAAQVAQSEPQNDGQPIPGLEHFKGTAALTKGYKDLQAFTVRTSQENKALKKQVEELKKQMEEAGNQQDDLAQYAGQTYQRGNPQQHGENPYAQDPEFQAAVMYAQNMASINEFRREMELNDPEFGVTWQMTERIAQSYPQLANDKPGVQKLYKEAKKKVNEQARMLGEKYIDQVLSDEQMAAKLRERLGLPQPQQSVQSQQSNIPSGAYMPDTSTSTRTGADSPPAPNYDDRIREAAEKGDVETTIENVFKRQLET